MQSINRLICLISLMVFMLAVASCGGSGGGSSSGGGSNGTQVALKLGIPANGASVGAATASIYSLKITVTAPDINPPIKKTVLINGRSSVTVTLLIPSGPGRLFTVDAYDAEGNRIYTGSAKADIFGSSANVEIVLELVQNNSYTVGGTVSGLIGTVVLKNNDVDDLDLSTDGSFTFDTPVADGEPYDVTVGTQPDGAFCTVYNGTGVISGADVTNVTVVCASGLGTISGTVDDALTSSPLGGVQVALFQDGVSIGSEMTNESGAYSITVNANTNYALTFSETGYLDANYYNVSVIANTTTYLDPVLQIDTGHSGPGDISGNITNAFSGASEPGINVLLRAGINNTSGDSSGSTTTNSDGNYSFESLPAGQYTAQLSAEGFTTTFFDVVCVGSVNTGNQNHSITPVISGTSIRIVLNWGLTPPDLDSHLTGPVSDGSVDRFHCYYGDTKPNDFVSLDHDVTTSYGPETITISQTFDGIYRYSVHDYTNSDYNPSSALGQSGAQAVVYMGDSIVGTFNVPNQPGTLWTVFEMDGNSRIITPVNSMTYQSDPAAITSISRTKTDANLIFNNLPPKTGAAAR